MGHRRETTLPGYPGGKGKWRQERLAREPDFLFPPGYLGRVVPLLWPIIYRVPCKYWSTGKGDYFAWVVCEKGEVEKRKTSQRA